MKPLRLLGLLFVFNLLVVSGTVYALRPKPAPPIQIKQVQIQKPNPKRVNFLEGTPATLEIPARNISTAVLAGEYEPTSRQWSLSATNPHFATITPKPNNSAGNTFIYGHNNRNVFSPILDLTPGAKAIITTDNKLVFTYTLRSVRDVSPTDVSLFEYKGPPILTIQTCSGNWYENRRLFMFELTGVTQP